MLYYNDENLMFASLASNRRQTVFSLRADLLDRMRVKAKKLGNSFITPILGLPRVHRQSSLRNSGNPHDG